jgi:alginate O-acetyltransferase complex protein AlgI
LRVLFNSHAFIFVFLPIAVAGFFAIGARSHGMAIAWLAGASLVFYGWWSVHFALLLCASIVANHLFARIIAAHARQGTGRRVLITAVTANLALLAVFKYANFFISSVTAVGGFPWALLDVILPLGISFYTFTQIAYLVDAYRGEAPAYGFSRYFLFVTYFPHLIAGPILHHREVIPQLDDASTFEPRAASFAVGVTLFAIGLAKKVWLADPLGEHADAVFAAAARGASLHFVAAWGGSLAYALQLYFDFSGYCDMAIGISLLFNIRLPLNFDSPYKSASIVEFWRRWHMTLSRFLRNYLYISLGGNRRGPARRRLNLVVTMLLGGLWHGASWTFVAWGGLHAIYLLVNHAWRESGRKLPRYIGAPITFIAVVCAWVLFRAADFPSAVSMLAGMSGAHGISFDRAEMGLRSAALLIAGLAIVWLCPNGQALARYSATATSTMPVPAAVLAPAAGVLLALSVMALTGISTFLYYQF